MRFVALWLVGLAACADSGTGGERVSVDFTVKSASIDEGPLDRTTSLVDPSWTIELDAAALLVGGVYAYPPPAQVTWLDHVGRFVGPSTAKAHGGDDNMAGRYAVFESLTAVPLDCLTTMPLSLGAFAAESGPIDTASVMLMPAFGELAATDAPTRGGVAFVRGRAVQEVEGEQDATVIPFEAVLPPGTTPLRRRVDQIVAEGALREGATITLEVYPQEWLREVDFVALQEAVSPGEDGVRRPGEATQFRAAFYLGVHSARAYRISVSNEDRGL